MDEAELHKISPQDYLMMNFVILALLADVADMREHMPGFLEVCMCVGKGRGRGSLPLSVE